MIFRRGRRKHVEAAERMRMNPLWKTLTRTQKAAWSAWAADNPVLLPNFERRIVSGRKAFTVVQTNRARASQPAEITVVPAGGEWLDGALGIYDAGPFTVGSGSLTLRTTVETEASRWFIWATPPLASEVAEAHAQLRFILCLVLAGTVEIDELTQDFRVQYEAACGSFIGPGVDGYWGEDPPIVWLKVHHYLHGNLSPGVMLKGTVRVDI